MSPSLPAASDVCSAHGSGLLVSSSFSEIRDGRQFSRRDWLLPSDSIVCDVRRSGGGSSPVCCGVAGGVFHDCAVGVTVGCAALCCCCPLTIITLLGVVFVKLPRTVWRKLCWFKSEKKRLARNYSDGGAMAMTVPVAVAWRGVVSPLLSPFAASSRGFGVFGDEQLSEELFQTGNVELVNISLRKE